MVVFLKLGGSLITDKNHPYTARHAQIQALSTAIAEVLHTRPDLHLLLGHGSGSFGHWAARQGNIRHGIRHPTDWQPFVRIGAAARRLNTLVMDALLAAGVQAVAIPPLATLVAENGHPSQGETAPLEAALQAGLVPVVYGDVVFDRRRGGVILSTEEVFAFLVPRLRPQRLLLAGVEPGVCTDYPRCRQVVPQITPASLPTLLPALGGSSGVDVTGGMLAKVQATVALVRQNPYLEALIFDGRSAETLQQALLGARPGTRILADDTTHT